MSTLTYHRLPPPRSAVIVLKVVKKVFAVLLVRVRTRVPVLTTTRRLVKELILRSIY